MANCEGCGTDVGGNSVPYHCPSCPPYTCDDCGGINHSATGLSCSCWIDLTKLSMADVKAIFAEDADCDYHETALSIDPIIKAAE